MKTKRFIKMVGIFVFSYLLWSKTACAAPLAETESSLSEDPTFYFRSNNQMQQTLEGSARTNSVVLRELQRSARGVLITKCPTNPSVAADCFKLKLQIAERLVRSSSIPTASNALALASFLGEIRSSMITNYLPSVVFVNVKPPLTPTNNNGMGYFEGMPPYAIAHPEARAAYEKAISENANNGKLNDLQMHTLPEINRAMTSLFLKYARASFDRNSEARGQLQFLAATAHLTEQEQAQFKPQK